MASHCRFQALKCVRPRMTWSLILDFFLNSSRARMLACAAVRAAADRSCGMSAMSGRSAARHLSGACSRSAIDSAAAAGLPRRRRRWHLTAFQQDWWKTLPRQAWGVCPGRRHAKHAPAAACPDEAAAAAARRRGFEVPAAAAAGAGA